MEAKFVKYLQRLPVFKDVPAAALAPIAGQIEVRHLVKGDVLMRQGTPGDSLFIIQTGWVEVVKESSQGQEVVLNQCGPGQLIGEMALVDQEPRSATVIALSPATVLELKQAVLLEAFQQHPILAIAFIRSLTDRLRFANTYLEEAIEWSRYIAQGNYSFVLDQVNLAQTTIVDLSRSDEARAGAFLAAFFKMIEEVKAREESLKQQVQQLTIQIDEVKRQRSVEELTDSPFFDTLQTLSKKRREERAAREKKPPEEE